MARQTDPLAGLSELGVKRTKRAIIRAILTTDEAWDKIEATHNRGVPYPEIARYLSETYGAAVDAWALADMVLERKRGRA